MRVREIWPCTCGSCAHLGARRCRQRRPTATTKEIPGESMADAVDTWRRSWSG